MSALLKAELSATCNTLGFLHDDSYTIDPQCYESVRDLIKFLRRDDEYHEIRRYLGEAKIVQSDLIHIIENCNEQQSELFDITIRLLVNLTNPVQLLYKEEVPIEKVGRNIYLSILGHLQDCKHAFTRIDAWKKISSKLSDLFEIDWSERSEDAGIQIERMLVLIRNVLQIPADDEKRVENDVNIHDQVLWGLRQSQVLELLLYISSNKYEEQYFIHILEIFSLILREQDPKYLANCEISRSKEEKMQDTNVLLGIREKEKSLSSEKVKKYTRHSNFGGTFVVKNVKSISDNDLIFHKPIQQVTELGTDKKRLKTPKNRIPEDTERITRRSIFSVRLFLKELCVEFLSSSYNGLMAVVKDKLMSGKALANDESYYFWAVKFFMEFNRNANLDIKHISETINLQTFHYIQTQLENCFERIMTDKKKINLWVKRLHIILKAYRELLETLNWLDQTENKNTSNVLKSQLFYMVEYRELVLYCLLKYDPTKFSKDYLKTLFETTHLFLKMFKSFCSQRNNKIVVQNKKKKHQKSKKVEGVEEKWEKVKDELLLTLTNNTEFPELSPFDPDLELESEEQKERAMKKIQNFFYNKQYNEGIGLLRSSRNVWPEMNCFGYNGMTREEEFKGIEDIFLADLGVRLADEEKSGEDDDNDEDGEDRIVVKEETLNYMDFVKRLANKRVVEACSVMLQNYSRNTEYTNHCVVKMLYRIGWECHMPSMLYQASFFVTLFKILKENRAQYKNINKFAIHLIRKFTENAANNPKIFMEILFWKDSKIAYEVETGYVENKGKCSTWKEEEENELRRLNAEFEETNPDHSDKVDWIMNNMINKDRSRRAVTVKMRELTLLPPGPVKRSKTSRPPKEWSEEETAELTELFHHYKQAMDIVGVISDHLTVKRPKTRIKDMIVELGLVSSRSELRKKRGGRSRPLDGESSSESESESESESGGDNDRPNKPANQVMYSLDEQKRSLNNIRDMKEALLWLQESFQEYLDDYDPADDGYPLLALDRVHVDALENPDFTQALTKLGLTPPQTHQYWRLPGTFTKHHLGLVVSMIKQAIDGTLEVQNGFSSDSDVETNKKESSHAASARHACVDSDSNSDNEGSDNRNVGNCIGSDSDGDVHVNVSKPKRGRGLINSDSESGDEIQVSNDHKRRKTLVINSDSEDDQTAPFRQRKIIIGEDTYEMEK